jgi:hypothetical protein
MRTTTCLCSLLVLVVVALPAPSPAQARATPQAVIWRDPGDMAKLKVRHMPKLHRGQSFVTADGTVHRARLERTSKDVKKVGDWDWFKNPFVGQRELNACAL